MRHTRSAMLEVLRSDYVRTARAKGLDEDAVVHRHALRNALVPIITLTTILFGELLAGAVLTEQVFTIPGFGKLIVDAVFNRDYGVVQGVVLCTAIGFILMNLLGGRALHPGQPAAEGAVMTTAATDTLATPPELALRPRPGVLARLARNRSALIGGAIVLVFVLMAVLAPLLPLADPLKSNFLAIRKPPSELYWFGTDELGRDQVARLFFGAQASLLAGIVSVVIALAIGIPFGLLAGWYGGWIDAAISRVTEAMLACPFLILAIAFAAVLGPSLTNAMIAIGLSAVPVFVRLVRAQVLSVKAEDFVEGARAVGARDLRIVLRHILPNILSPIVVQSTLFMAQAIILEAALSFLGLGQQPPAPSWGQMLNVAKNFMEQAPWMSVAPGVCIFLAVLGFNLLGDGLRDVLDPKEG